MNFSINQENNLGQFAVRCSIWREIPQICLPYDAICNIFKTIHFYILLNRIIVALRWEENVKEGQHVCATDPCDKTAWYLDDGDGPCSNTCSEVRWD